MPLEHNLPLSIAEGNFLKDLKYYRDAVDEAKKKVILEKIFSDQTYSLEIIVHPGAGAYIAGEETAQLNSLEGFRATPRLKPPFPAVAGLYGKPTIVNNVETLCNVVHIVNHGAGMVSKYRKAKKYWNENFSNQWTCSKSRML